MESETRDQILEEAVCILFYANTVGKGIHSSVLSVAVVGK